jgi:hypothetical protein
MIYRALQASTIVCQSLALVALFSVASSAQTAPPEQPAPISAEPSDQNDSGQIVLAEKQIQELIAAQKAIGAIVEKIPEDQQDSPNPIVQAALDKAAKSYGFKDYGEYDDVANNIAFLMEGFDREKKTFIGHEMVLKAKIAEVRDDAKMSPRDKEEQIRDLKDMLKSVEPVKFTGNITLVAKYFDKLDEFFPEDE